MGKQSRLKRDNPKRKYRLANVVRPVEVCYRCKLTGGVMRARTVTLYYHDEGANPCQPIKFAKSSVRVASLKTT